MSNEFVNLENSRVEEQKRVMEQIVKDGVCPFCPEHLAKYHKKPILKEGVHWVLTPNQWPYSGAKHHYMLFSKKHLETLEDLTPEAGAEMIELFQGLAKEIGLTGGALAMRFGNEMKFGNSVKHLHVHLIEPDVENPEHEGLRFKISNPKVKKSDN